MSNTNNYKPPDLQVFQELESVLTYASLDIIHNNIEASNRAPVMDELYALRAQVNEIIKDHMKEDSSRNEEEIFEFNEQESDEQNQEEEYSDDSNTPNNPDCGLIGNQSYAVNTQKQAPKEENLQSSVVYNNTLNISQIMTDFNFNFARLNLSEYYSLQDEQELCDFEFNYFETESFNNNLKKMNYTSPNSNTPQNNLQSNTDDHIAIFYAIRKECYRFMISQICGSVLSLIDDSNSLKHFFIDKAEELKNVILLGGCFSEIQNMIKKNTFKKEIKSFLQTKAFFDGIFQENLVDFGKNFIVQGYQKETNEVVTFDRLLNKLILLKNSQKTVSTSLLPIYSQLVIYFIKALDWKVKLVQLVKADNSKNIKRVLFKTTEEISNSLSLIIEYNQNNHMRIIFGRKLISPDLDLYSKDQSAKKYLQRVSTEKNLKKVASNEKFDNNDKIKSEEKGSPIIHNKSEILKIKGKNLSMNDIDGTFDQVNHHLNQSTPDDVFAAGIEVQKIKRALCLTEPDSFETEKQKDCVVDENLNDSPNKKINSTIEANNKSKSFFHNEPKENNDSNLLGNENLQNKFKKIPSINDFIAEDDRTIRQPISKGSLTRMSLKENSEYQRNENFSIYDDKPKSQIRDHVISERFQSELGKKDISSDEQDHDYVDLNQNETDEDIQVGNLKSKPGSQTRTKTFPHVKSELGKKIQKSPGQNIDPIEVKSSNQIIRVDVFETQSEFQENKSQPLPSAFDVNNSQQVQKSGLKYHNSVPLPTSEFKGNNSQASDKKNSQDGEKSSEPALTPNTLGHALKEGQSNRSINQRSSNRSSRHKIFTKKKLETTDGSNKHILDQKQQTPEVVAQLSPEKNIIENLKFQDSNNNNLKTPTNDSSYSVSSKDGTSPFNNVNNEPTNGAVEVIPKNDNQKDITSALLKNIPEIPKFEQIELIPDNKFENKPESNIKQDTSSEDFNEQKAEDQHYSPFESKPVDLDWDKSALLDMLGGFLNECDSNMSKISEVIKPSAPNSISNMSQISRLKNPTYNRNSVESNYQGQTISGNATPISTNFTLDTELTYPSYNINHFQNSNRTPTKKIDILLNNDSKLNLGVSEPESQGNLADREGSLYGNRRPIGKYDNNIGLSSKLQQNVDNTTISNNSFNAKLTKDNSDLNFKRPYSNTGQETRYSRNSNVTRSYKPHYTYSGISSTGNIQGNNSTAYGAPNTNFNNSLPSKNPTTYGGMYGGSYSKNYTNYSGNAQYNPTNLSNTYAPSTSNTNSTNQLHTVNSNQVPTTVIASNPNLGSLNSSATNFGSNYNPSTSGFSYGNKNPVNSAGTNQNQGTGETDSSRNPGNNYTGYNYSGLGNYYRPRNT